MPLHRIPWLLIWFRAFAALTPWICQAFGLPMAIALGMIPLALLSDIYDGKIARAYKVDTVLLRRADGWADNAFTLSYTVFVLIFRFENFEPWIDWVVAIGLYRGARAGLDFWKYGRGSAYHLYSAKAWGLTYYAMLAVALGNGPMAWAMIPMLALGFYNTTEGILATLRIPLWIVDAPHLSAAVKKGEAAWTAWAAENPRDEKGLGPFTRRNAANTTQTQQADAGTKSYP